MNPKHSVQHLGGICAALIALCHLFLGAARLFTDTETNNLWQAFLQDSGAGRYLLLLITFLLLAVVPAVEQLFERDRALSGWLGQVAFLGLFASALARVQDSTVSVLFYSVDAKGWLGMGCLVAWAVGVGLLAWRRAIWPTWLSLAALAWAGLLAGAMGGGMFWQESLVRTALFLACFVVAPIWFGGLSRHLLVGNVEGVR